MSRRSKSHFRRRLVLWGLLALLCIGLTELAVCAYADPALFQRITAPASRLFQTVRTAGAGLLDQLTPEEAPVSLPVILPFQRHRRWRTPTLQSSPSGPIGRS